MTGLDNPVAIGSTALIATIAIQAMKNSGWASWFNHDTSKANLALSVVVAFLTATGIHLTYNQLTGDGAITFNVHTIWEAVVQWATQHAAYKGFVAPAETLGEIRQLLKLMVVQGSASPPNVVSNVKSQP